MEKHLSAIVLCGFCISACGTPPAVGTASSEPLFTRNIVQLRGDQPPLITQVMVTQSQQVADHATFMSNRARRSQPTAGSRSDAVGSLSQAVISDSPSCTSSNVELFIWDNTSGWDGGGDESCIMGSGNIALSNLGRLCELCLSGTVYVVCNCQGTWDHAIRSYQEKNVDGSAGSFECTNAQVTIPLECADAQVTISGTSDCATTGTGGYPTALTLDGNCGL